MSEDQIVGFLLFASWFSLVVGMGAYLFLCEFPNRKDVK